MIIGFNGVIVKVPVGLKYVSFNRSNRKGRYRCLWSIEAIHGYDQYQTFHHTYFDKSLALLT